MASKTPTSAASPPLESSLAGEISHVVPEFHLAGVLSVDGRHLVITEHTKGVDWRLLQAGQRIRMCVQGDAAPRVVSAEILP